MWIIQSCAMQITNVYSQTNTQNSYALPTTVKDEVGATIELNCFKGNVVYRCDTMTFYHIFHFSCSELKKISENVREVN